MAGATALMGQHHRRSRTRQLASQSPRTPVENCCREGSKLAAAMSPAPPQGTFATGRSLRAPRHPWERHRVRLRAVGSQPWQAVNATAPPAPGSAGAREGRRWDARVGCSLAPGELEANWGAVRREQPPQPSRPGRGCGQRGQGGWRPAAEHTWKAAALSQEPEGSCNALLATSVTELGVSVRTESAENGAFPPRINSNSGVNSH